MKRGEVVRLNWPYSDFTGSKIRPAIVVQADSLLAFMLTKGARPFAAGHLKELRKNEAHANISGDSLALAHPP
jgi:hypothetical protein